MKDSGSREKSGRAARLNDVVGQGVIFVENGGHKKTAPQFRARMMEMKMKINDFG